MNSTLASATPLRKTKRPLLLRDVRPRDGIDGVRVLAFFVRLHACCPAVLVGLSLGLCIPLGLGRSLPDLVDCGGELRGELRELRLQARGLGSMPFCEL